MNWDTDWYLAINRAARASSWLHGFMADYALWGGLVALSLLLIVGWWTVRSRVDAPVAVAATALTGLSVVGVLLINQHLLSPLIARPRPCATLPGVQVLLPCNADYSMPSDHCIMAGAFLAGLWFVGRLAGSMATALAILLAFSRVYVGVHYPSDTLVGLAVGAAISVIVVAAGRRPLGRLVGRLGTSSLWWVVRSQPATNAAAPLGAGQ